jgi:hypothetical protein
VPFKSVKKFDKTENIVSPHSETPWKPLGNPLGFFHSIFRKKFKMKQKWTAMTQTEFISQMVTLGGNYREGLFPNGSWKLQGSILSANRGGVLVGQYDDATGEGLSRES